MIVQSTLTGILQEAKVAKFSKDLLWLFNEYNFRQVFGTKDNAISILASPYCSFCLYVDTEKCEIRYLDLAIVEMFVNEMSEDAFRQWYAMLQRQKRNP